MNYNSKFEKKIRKFINFLINNNKIEADIHNFECNSDSKMVSIRLVPHDYNIREIPVFKKYCKIVGLECLNEFNVDEERYYGYKEYHDCKLYDDGTFFKNKLMEELE